MFWFSFILVFLIAYPFFIWIYTKSKHSILKAFLFYIIFSNIAGLPFLAFGTIGNQNSRLTIQLLTIIFIMIAPFIALGICIYYNRNVK